MEILLLMDKRRKCCCFWMGKIWDKLIQIEKMASKSITTYSIQEAMEYLCSHRPISEMKIAVEITTFLKFIITCSHSQNPPRFCTSQKESEHLVDSITFSIFVLRWWYYSISSFCFGLCSVGGKETQWGWGGGGIAGGLHVGSLP